MSLLSSFFRSGTDHKALRDAGAVVVDVRNADEWAAGHLDGSTLIPLPALPGRVAEVEKLVGGDKAKPVLLVCRSGGRAESARAILQQHGFTNVKNAGAWTTLR